MFFRDFKLLHLAFKLNRIIGMFIDEQILNAMDKRNNTIRITLEMEVDMHGNRKCLKIK